MPKNQDSRTTEKIKKGRPRKIEDSKLDKIMSEYITTVQTENGQEHKAIMGDAEIAEDITEKHEIRVSPDFIYRYRKNHNVSSHYSQGGPGRPPKITDNDLSRILAEFIITEIKSGKKITRQTDAEIAEAIQKKHRVEISESTIRRYRQKHNITARHRKHGGKRPGAGRPKTDDMPPVKKTRNNHKLTISDYSMVKACPSAYDFVPGVWNEAAGRYDRLARYVPKFRQDGLKTYTPVIPFPDRYSKAQKYAAIQGF